MPQVDNAINIYPASALTDANQLRAALESAIVNPVTKAVIYDEVDEVLASVEASRQGQSGRYYAVAVESGDKVLGMMGIKSPPDEAMLEYTTTDNAAELVNAYILEAAQGSGIGRLLLSHLEAKAVELGHDELVVNSGIRYRRSGWPFWNRVYGEPVAIAKGYYEQKFDAMVWRNSLVEEK